MTDDRRPTTAIRAAFLSIGDEIVNGVITDTNAAFLGDAVRSVGVEPVGTLSAPDDPAAIRRALERALEDAEVVIATGGLGPTVDDLTSRVVAEAAGRALVVDEPSLRHTRELLARIGAPFTPNNAKQAMIPEGSTAIPNPAGTAAGFLCPVERGGATRHVVCLPGVPREMRRMMEETVLPWLRERAPGRVFASRTLSLVGLGESRADQLLEGVVDPAEARLSFRVSFPKLQVRLAVEGAPGDALEARLDALEARVRERLGRHVHASGDEGLEETVGRLLRERGLTLAVAESCTGGLIGSRLTDVAGSSAYLLLGVVAYSNEAKVRLLGVREATLAAHGAVSTQTAEEMAAGARRAIGADLGLSTTGIAGPGGGSRGKPVGTVCVGLAWEGGSWSRRYQLGERERAWIKGMTAQVALDRLRRYLLGDEG